MLAFVIRCSGIELVERGLKSDDNLDVGAN